MGDHEGTLQIEYDDISVKTILISTSFVGTCGTLRFNEISFFNTLKGFTHVEIINLLMQFMVKPRVCMLVMKIFI